MGATLVTAVDATFAEEGEHVFYVSLDGTQIASLPLNVLINGRQSRERDAMGIRAQWMRELGMSEEEIESHCEPASGPANMDEEVANLNALRRMRSSKWSI